MFQLSARKPRERLYSSCLWLLAMLMLQALPARAAGDPALLLNNVQNELKRLGADVSLVPLPRSTATHLYAEPLWAADGIDELWQRLLNKEEWHSDAGLTHRLSHPGSRIGFRQKQSPSLHIIVYPSGPTYVYEFHYDRFLAVGRKPVSALKHIFGEVIPNRYFGKETSQQHIDQLIQRRRGGAGGAAIQ
jgi:hypothetical protein